MVAFSGLCRFSVRSGNNLYVETDTIVGDHRLLCPSVGLEVEDMVVGQHLDICVDISVVALESIGELTDTLQWRCRS